MPEIRQYMDDVVRKFRRGLLTVTDAERMIDKQIDEYLQREYFRGRALDTVWREVTLLKREKWRLMLQATKRREEA